MYNIFVNTNTPTEVRLHGNRNLSPDYYITDHESYILDRGSYIYFGSCRLYSGSSSVYYIPVDGGYTNRPTEVIKK